MVAVHGVGPRTVRVWFDTVINPIIAGLETEQALLTADKLTWRCRTRDFDRLLPVSTYVETRFRPNLDDLADGYPDIQVAFSDRDRVLSELRASVLDLQETLTSSPQFKQAFENCTSLQALESMGVTSAADLFGGYPANEWISEMAQYVINNTGTLGSHYSISVLWNRFGAELKAGLDAPDVVGRHGTVCRMRTRLGDADRDLELRMKDLRRVLARDHDQPFVSPDNGRGGNDAYFA